MSGCNCSKKCLGDLAEVYGLRGLAAPFDASVLGKDFFYNAWGSDGMPADVTVIYHPLSEDRPALTLPRQVSSGGSSPAVAEVSPPSGLRREMFPAFPWGWAIAIAAGVYFVSRGGKR